MVSNILDDKSDLAKPTSPAQVMVKVVNCLSGEVNNSLNYPTENHDLEVFKKFGLKIKDISKWKK